jgi:predicted Rossmann fold nucleotide-binding protein DprA/Smf involved in DNA uptake
MSTLLSPNSQAILLLTTPLIVGRGQPSSELLSQGEYNRLARILRESDHQPADLLGPNAGELIKKCRGVIEGGRLERLLGRGFLLSQAIEHWQARGLWVVSRADPNYPRRLKARLKEDAPPVLYGSGEMSILETGGLAIVGSRHVDDALLDYTEGVGRLASMAGRTVISGGARGIDQAAMRGALRAGGNVVGVLADSLERTALARDNREALMSTQLVLISPYDPGAGFNVGHAMQRNKLVYALSDVALVVNSDYENGGTWAGAVEQLAKLRLVPIYVRSGKGTGRGLEELRRMGALPWPNPTTTGALADALSVQSHVETGSRVQEQLAFSSGEELEKANEIQSERSSGESPVSQAVTAPATPADALFAKVRELLEHMGTPKNESEVAADLQVSKIQAREWLQRLVDEGVLEKLAKPTRYRSAIGAGRLL